MDAYVPLSGGVSLTGTLQGEFYGSFNTKDNSIVRQSFNGAITYPSTLAHYAGSGGSGKPLSMIYYPKRMVSSSDFNNRISLLVYDPTVDNAFSELGIGYNSSGVYTQAPSPATSDNSTKIATTAYVKGCVPKSVGNANIPVYTDANGVITSTGKSFANYATLASPALTGTPTAPTAAVATNNTQIATTAFVKSALSTWTSVTVTAVTTYCLSVGGNYMSVYQNPYLKLCCVGFNMQLAATTIPGNTAIVNGFPKALHNFGCVCMDSSGVGIRMYISTTGSLMLDGAKTLSSSTWVNGSVTYPYSSL